MLRILLSLFAFSPAFGLMAQDFFGAGITAQTAARAGIYTPAPDNALDALSLNPAGLSSLTGRVLNLSAAGLLARGTFQNASNQNSPMQFTAGAVPYGAVGLPLSRRWTIGVGFMPDLVSSSKWKFADTPGTAGANYGVQHETSRILAFRTTSGVAYRLSSRVSVGATVSGIYNSNTLIMPYVFQSHPVLKGLKTLLDLHTSGIGWNTSLGVIVRPSRRWEVGSSYRSSSSIESTGKAMGNMSAQFAALRIPFRPDFGYSAKVRVELPQSAIVYGAWQKSAVLRLSIQAGWTDWNRSFANLPVTLTKGTNSDINGLLGSSSIFDRIPLHWKSQFSFRGSAVRQLGESFSVSGGYVHQNNPVPSSTLSPLTAAVMSNGLTAGGGYVRGRARLDIAYQIRLNNAERVGTSSLSGGEFSGSKVNIGTQGLVLSASVRL